MPKLSKNNNPEHQVSLAFYTNKYCPKIFNVIGKCFYINTICTLFEYSLSTNEYDDLINKLNRKLPDIYY